MCRLEQVFYQKMKADYYRYIAEFRNGDAKAQAAEEARKAYADAAEVAEKELAATWHLEGIGTV